MNRRYYLIVESEYITSFKDKETLLNALWLMTGHEELRNSDEIFEPLLLLRKKKVLRTLLFHYKNVCHGSTSLLTIIS